MLKRLRANTHERNVYGIFYGIFAEIELSTFPDILHPYKLKKIGNDYKVIITELCPIEHERLQEKMLKIHRQFSQDR